MISYTQCYLHMLVLSTSVSTPLVQLVEYLNGINSGYVL